MVKYTHENTEGYSPQDLENLNELYEHRIAGLDEDQRENPDYLQHISEQVLQEYDQLATLTRIEQIYGTPRREEGAPPDLPGSVRSLIGSLGCERGMLYSLCDELLGGRRYLSFAEFQDSLRAEIAEHIAALQRTAAIGRPSPSPRDEEGELAESLLRSGVSSQQVADLRQTGDLRCSVCGRVLEVVEEDGETTWIACPVYSTGAPDAGEHSSVRLDRPRE
jgi:hypothetical protein